MTHFTRRGLCAILAVLMTLGVLFGTLIVPTSAKDIGITNGTGSRGAFTVTSPLGYRVNLTEPFVGFGFATPTWTTTTAGYDVAAYYWKGSYKATIAEEPFAFQEFRNIKDNSTGWVTFDEKPAGEYLFLITNPIGSLGVWMHANPRDPVGHLYINGLEQTGDPELNLRFEGDVSAPFAPCTPSTDAIDGNHQSPPEAELPADSLINTHPVMPDTWVFTDGLGRESLTNADVGDLKDDKTLAMFYWTWHMNFKGAGAYNNEEFLKKYPESIHDIDHPAWSSVNGCQLFWNEPIYGYYAEDDAWVVRRQGEMLANAGVDAVLTDNTNGTFTWQSAYRSVFETWAKAKADGVRTPKLSFMLPFAGGADTATQLRALYTDFFRNGEFQDQWFYLDGKPMIMAHTSGTGLNKNDMMDKEILNFFTYRGGYAGYVNGGYKNAFGQWGWLSITPQAYYHGTRENRKEDIVEQITVGVAMNHSYVYDCIAPMNGIGIMGRSYTTNNEDRYDKEGDEASKWGYNFAEQWNYALEVDPKVVFVTGWNEWIAGRHASWPEGYISAVENAMPDQCNDEFSRDIEPSKGALQDHYYYQLVNNARRFKGARPIPTPSFKATIDITADNSQWSTVEPYYASYIGNTADRDAVGFGYTRYTEYSGRNDIIGSRVARDDEFVYFYVECNETITPYTDKLWMNLYIDADQSNAGWNTFDYVLNKTAPTADKATLERFTGDGYASEAVGEVDYTVSGKYMQVKVPKTMLGLSGDDFTINFTWTDNVHDADDMAKHDETDYVYSKFSGDIMNFYISGDVAPGGRFKFSYISTAANATGSTETTPDTTPDTDPTPVESETEGATVEDATEAPTVAVTEGETKGESGGCKSVMGAGAAVLVAMAAAVALRKERDE